MSQVLAEYQPDGTLIASYVYADDLISMTCNAHTYYYHFDGLGSTRLLTDSGGNVTDTYDYDAFGNLINHTGTTDNPFLFTGQQYDTNIGFYYLRARYYQPNTGRFTSLDSFEGDPYAPMSLHKYLYAANDPVNKIDPSGEQTLSELLVTISLINILKTVETPSFSTKCISRGFCEWTGKMKLIGFGAKTYGGVIIHWDFESECCNCRKVTAPYITLCGGISIGILPVSFQYIDTSFDFLGPGTPSDTDPAGPFSYISIGASIPGLSFYPLNFIVSGDLAGLSKESIKVADPEFLGMDIGFFDALVGVTLIYDTGKIKDEDCQN